MSTKMTTWVFHSDVCATITGNRFTALLALADIANDDGDVIFAKRGEGNQAALARKARQSVPTFKRVIRELQELGLLEVTRASATAENSYRLTTTRDQSDLWITSGSETRDQLSTDQDDPSHGSPSDPSQGSTVIPHKNVFNVGTNPLTPAERGNRRSPNQEVLDALRGRPLATITTRTCTDHDRQRTSCVACWTVRPLSIDDVPWCGDAHCDKNLRLRPHGNVMTVCPECHPRGIDPARAVQLLEAR